MNRRRGIMLVEVIMAITIATAVIGVLTVAVSRLILSNAAAHEHLQTVVTLGRLGEQFRRDAHAARDATIEAAPEQPTRLKLQGDADWAVEYEITPDGLQRVATAAGQAEHRDRFVLPGMKFLGWKMDEDGRAISLLVGRLARPATDEPALSGRFSIDGLLARAEQPSGSE